MEDRRLSLSGTVILFHVVLMLLGVSLAAGFLLFPIQIGSIPLAARAAVSATAGLALALGARPFIPWFARHWLIYLVVVGLPAAVCGPWYFLEFLPSNVEPGDDGISGEQLASSLITESTSNGIVEIGFAYPIYTPTISVTNTGLFSRAVDVYLRVLDGNNEAVLFRAVRAELPDARLSVEGTVHGLLSESPGYLFIPFAIPPQQTVAGRVVFIISDLNDGTTFNQALGRSYPAEFQIREPETGELLERFPLTGI